VSTELYRESTSVLAATNKEPHCIARVYVVYTVELDGRQLVFKNAYQRDRERPSPDVS